MAGNSGKKKKDNIFTAKVEWHEEPDIVEKNPQEGSLGEPSIGSISFLYGSAGNAAMHSEFLGRAERALKKAGKYQSGN